MKKPITNWINFQERKPKIGTLIAILIRNQVQDPTGKIIYEDVHNCHYTAFYKRKYAHPFTDQTLNDGHKLVKSIAFWYPLPKLPDKSIKVFRDIYSEDETTTKPKVKLNFP